MRATIVSFYTPQYYVHLADFMSSVHAFRLQMEVEKLPTRGSWRLNCGFKPRFMLKMIERFGPCVWLDIDARVKEYPALFDELVETSIDFATYFIPNKYMRPSDVPLGEASRNPGLASGTMFFNDTEAAKELLHRWIGHDRGQHSAEQFVLGEAWHLYEKEIGLHTRGLPQAYCKVFDQAYREGEHGPDVIEHLQASRKLRGLVNRQSRTKRSRSRKGQVGAKR